MEYQPPQFFNRGPAPVVRLGFFVLLSVLLMILDARFQYADPLRAALSVAAYPLQQAALAPVQLSATSHTPAAVRHTVVGRRVDAAREFAQRYGYRKVAGSLEEALTDPAIDVVIRGTPSDQHEAQDHGQDTAVATADPEPPGPEVLAQRLGE